MNYHFSMKNNKMKKPYTPAKKLTQKEWAKVDKEYVEDMNVQIAANKSDLDNWINVVENKTIIPITNEELVAWKKLSKTDKRKIARSIRKKIASGAFEYVDYKDIKLIRPTYDRKD